MPKMSKIAIKATSMVRGDSLFAAVVKFVFNIGNTFEKKHGVSFLATQTMDIVKKILSSDFLANKILQEYQRYIWKTKFLLQNTKSIIIFVVIDEEETESRMLSLSHSDDRTLSTSCTEVELLLVRAAEKYVQIQCSTLWSMLRLSTRAEDVFCASYMTCTIIKTRPAPLFSIAFHYASPSANKTTTATMEQMFFISIRLQGHERRKKKRGGQSDTSDSSSAWPVWGQVSDLNRNCVCRRPRHRTERHSNHTPLVKAHRAGLRSNCWLGVGDRKPRQRLYSSSRTNPKTAVQCVYWWRYTDQRESDPDRSAKSQTQPSQQVRSSCLKWNGALRRCATWCSACPVCYRGSFRRRNFDGLGLQREEAHEIFRFALCQ